MINGKRGVQATKIRNNSGSTWLVKAKWMGHSLEFIQPNFTYNTPTCDTSVLCPHQGYPLACPASAAVSGDQSGMH